MLRTIPEVDPTPRPAGGTLLLNNYRATGIGDFGLELRARLGGPVTYLETDPDGHHERSQLREVRAWNGPAIINLGLTAWGSSALRNLVGYFHLSRRVRRTGPETIVLVHNLIEAMDAETTGYPVPPWVRVGAHWAVAHVTGAKLVAFSRTVGELLRSRYHTPPALLTPLPCAPGRGVGSPQDPALGIVVPGYLSPYNGH